MGRLLCFAATIASYGNSRVVREWLHGQSLGGFATIGFSANWFGRSFAEWRALIACWQTSFRIRRRTELPE